MTTAFRHSGLAGPLDRAGSAVCVNRLGNQIAFGGLRTPSSAKETSSASPGAFILLSIPQRRISTIARVTQLPAALEFDVGPRMAEQVHYTGPFVHAQQRPPIEFPWERLDGRPLIYASLGTLQNGSENLFRAIAEACAPLDAQLLISLGGRLDPARLGTLAGDPMLVRYAPQLEILKRAALVITHGGINTVLESLSEGVPMVVVPLANDQPGMAARVKARGAGLVVPRRRTQPIQASQRHRAGVASSEVSRGGHRAADGHSANEWTGGLPPISLSRRSKSVPAQPVA